MSRLEFAAPARVLFGAGTLKEAGPAAAALGRKALVVTNRGAGRADPLLRALDDAGVEAVILTVCGEPSLETARDAAALLKGARCGLVIGFGGGSALDTAKAAAALRANGGDPLDYVEVVGRGLPLRKPSLPTILIPTTAGSGSEATRNAVLASPREKVKVSLRSSHLLARLALVDPELCLGLPPGLTASTGLDALTQLIEPFVSLKANPVTDGLCREGMRLSARSLLRACRDGQDLSARADLSLAGLFGGLALANAGLGAAHGLAGPLGGAFPAPHGALCARLLPEVMRANLAALRRDAPQSPALERYAEAARLLTGRPGASAEDGAAWVAELAAQLGIPRLSAYGVAAADLPGLAARSLAASSMKANPAALDASALQGVLEACL